MHKNGDNQVRYWPPPEAAESVEALDYVMRGACSRDSKPRGVFLAKVLRLFKSKLFAVSNVTATARRRRV